MKEIPIVIDPTLNIDPQAFKKAWENNSQSRELGHLETQSAGHFGASGMELIWIPLAVSVASNLVTEVIIKLVERNNLIRSNTRPHPTELLVKVEKLPDGKEVLLVELKSDHQD